MRRNAYLYENVDLVLSRSGAMTISELIKFKKPSILVPFKFSSENHQHFNAKFLHDNLCSKLIEEDNFSNETFISTLRNISQNDRILNSMKSNFNNIDIPDTLSIISNFILEKNMLYSVKKVHLIGIGGIGMSGIAELLKNKEFLVSGSDIVDSPIVQRLINLGINVSIGHNKENISDAELVIYSDAIPENNVELIEAYSKNILVYSRAKMISEIAKLNNSTVAIAGTHGKTTTTSMVGTILKSMNLDPTIIVGGVIKSLSLTQF